MKQIEEFGICDNEQFRTLAIVLQVYIYNRNTNGNAEVYIPGNLHNQIELVYLCTNYIRVNLAIHVYPLRRPFST